MKLRAVKHNFLDHRTKGGLAPGDSWFLRHWHIHMHTHSYAHTDAHTISVHNLHNIICNVHTLACRKLLVPNDP